MNIRKNLPFLAAALLGLVTAAYGGGIDIDEHDAPNITHDIELGSNGNCPSPLAGCNVYDVKVSAIDPFCCSETTTHCQNYKVEMWKCAAGATRYRYFLPSGSPIPGDACGPTGCGS